MGFGQKENGDIIIAPGISKDPKFCQEISEEEYDEKKNIRSELQKDFTWN